MKNKRIARYKKITEVFCRSFSLSNRNSVTIRGIVKEIFRLRDLAAHPSGDIASPVLHPELQTGVEWSGASQFFAPTMLGPLSWHPDESFMSLSPKGNPRHRKLNAISKDY